MNSGSPDGIILHCLPYFLYHIRILIKLNDFFTSIGSITAQKARDLSLHHGLNVNSDVPTPLHISTDVSPELFVLHQVTENQVERVIRSLPSNKAPGMDKISSRILKDSLPSTLTTITHIICE